MNEKKV